MAKKTTDQKKHGTGALLNAPDNRNISIEQVATARGYGVGSHPKKNITDLSMLPVENQGQHGTCVGQAAGKGQEYRDLKETGKVTRLSKKFIYKSCKMIDGFTGQGTYPKIEAQILGTKGTPKEELLPDNNTANYDVYMNVDIVTPEILTDASARRTKGYAYATSLNEIKTGIDMEGTLTATLRVGDWSTLPVKPFNKNGLNDGWHRVLLYGYEDVGTDTKIYFRNSWGTSWAKGKNTEDKKLIKAGNGYFMWSDYAKGNYADIMVYTDMPNEIIDHAKGQTYKFTRTLKRGMSGTDVQELQKRLAKEYDIHQVPLFNYPAFTTYFGSVTNTAVKKYQTINGLKPDGVVGKNTIAKLNAGIKEDPKEPDQPTTGNLIEKWAEGIQKFEGWFKGSRSYRNNNPGNIRYIGQKRAIGEDDKNFCIFKTYADGRQELIEMLLRAAEGRSRVYKPTMTLLDFFKTYAPSSDNNHPETYAAAVAKMIGVSIGTQIKELLPTKAQATNTNTMLDLFKDVVGTPAKAVFLMLALTVCIAFIMGLLEAADFVMLTAMAFGFYFGMPGPKDPGEPAGRGK